MITSSSNAQVKNIIALNKKAKERREHLQLKILLKLM